MTYKPKKQENSIDFYSLNDFEMKVLLATEKPFAKVASDGIREIVEKAGYELVVLEKYTDKSELLKAVADVDAIIIRSDKITAEVIEAAKNMARNKFTPGTGTEIHGKRLGIHAYGNVGKLVARYGKGFGMEVYAYDPFITDKAVYEKDGVIPVGSVEELYSKCDYVSVHIPATEQTKKSINYDLLSKMPKGATIVNTARKEVIDEEGLAKVLAERTDLKYVTDIAADMQVVLNEKFGNRVFATPKKMGAETQEANVNAALAAANQIVAFFTKGENRFQVNKW